MVERLHGMLGNKISHFPEFDPQVAELVPKENVDKVRIVYLLTLNGRAVRQVHRLLKALYDKDHFYYIHIDEVIDLSNFSNQFPFIFIFPATRLLVPRTPKARIESAKHPTSPNTLLNDMGRGVTSQNATNCNGRTVASALEMGLCDQSERK